MANVIIKRNRIVPGDRVQQREIAQARDMLQRYGNYNRAKVESAAKFLKTHGLKVERKDIFGEKEAVPVLEKWEH